MKSISYFRGYFGAAVCVCLLSPISLYGQVELREPLTTSSVETNEFCPVIPDQPSDPQFQAVHNGRSIRFCCADCVRRFEADPESYVGNLPPIVTIKPVADPNRSFDENLARVLSPVAKIAGYAADRPWLTTYLVAIVSLAALCYRRSKRTSGNRDWSEKLRTTITRPSVIGLLVLGGLCVQFAVELWSNSSPGPPPSQFNFQPTAGNSAANSTIAWPQSLHEIPHGLSNVYYRGNDERSEKLFNGGKYRTATFYLSVRNENGQELRAGNDVGTTPLFLHCRIVRAPNTAREFFTETRMSAFRLSRVDGKDSKNETRPIKVLRSEWEWEVQAPVGTPSGVDYQGFRGIWHLGTGDNQPHYGIQYAIHLRDGKILPESVVWMFAILQSPILDGPTADGEWFSDRPIAEIPDGKGVTDPKLLGLTKPAAPKGK